MIRADSVILLSLHLEKTAFQMWKWELENTRGKLPRYKFGCYRCWSPSPFKLTINTFPLSSWPPGIFVWKNWKDHCYCGLFLFTILATFLKELIWNFEILVLQINFGLTYFNVQMLWWLKVQKNIMIMFYFMLLNRAGFTVRWSRFIFCFPHSVTLDKLLNLFEPLFPPLKSDSDGIYQLQTCWESNITVECTCVYICTVCISWVYTHMGGGMLKTIPRPSYLFSEC